MEVNAQRNKERQKQQLHTAGQALTKNRLFDRKK